jgi:hypothetical protein
MKLFACDDDRKTYELFRESGVIGDYTIKNVAGQQTCSWCADGFRPHMREKIEGNCRVNGGENSFFHSPAGNGDAMRFAFNSPLSQGFSRYGDPDVWGRLKLEEIRETLGWAEDLSVHIEQHRLIHHWPCKAALSRGITFAQSIDLVIRGKFRIKHQIPGLKVAIDFFCDWDKEKYTLDLIKKEPYLKLIETDPRFTKEHSEWCAYVEEVNSLPVLG